MLTTLLTLCAALAFSPAQADPVPSESPTFLFIADSHGVGAFGRALDDNLRALPGVSNVRTYASCGSSVDWWFSGKPTPCGYLERLTDGHGVRARETKRAPTPLLPKLLEAFGSDPHARKITLVALGSNMIEALEPGEAGPRAVRESVERAVDAIGKSGSLCIWIGPPDMRHFGKQRIQKIYELIAAALTSRPGSSCSLIDSRKYTSYPPKGGDGVHYYFPGGAEIARKWAAGVFKEISGIMEDHHAG